MHKKNKRKPHLQLLAILLVLTMLFSIISSGMLVSFAAADEKSLAEGTDTTAPLAAGDAKSSAPFTAWLYNDSSYSDTNGTELTAEGAVGTPWDYQKPTRYLVIRADFTSGNGGTVTITLPTGMALASSNYTQADKDIESVSFQKLTGLSGRGGQGTGDYSNNLTGTLTYIFGGTATEKEIIIPVTFDQAVWDKNAALNTDKSRGRLTALNQPPITVTMTVGESSSTKLISDLYASTASGQGGEVYTAYHPGTVLRGENTTMQYTDLRNVDTYWQSFTVEYFLPKNSNGVRATYVGEPTQAPSLNYTVPQKVNSSDPEKIVYTWENVKFGGFVFMSPILNFSNSFADGDLATFQVRFTGVSYSGSTITRSGTLKTTIVDKKAILNPYLDTYSVYTKNQDNYSANTVEHLGNISIENSGYAASGKLKMVYDFDTNTAAGIRNAIDVSYIRLPVVKGNTAAATCTMVDKNGQNAFTVTVTTSASVGNVEGTPLAASDVKNAAGKTGDWYFKRVEYEIESIPALTQLFRKNAIRTPGNAGNYYGFLNGSVASSRLTVYNLKEDGTQAQLFQQVVSTKQTPNNYEPLYIYNVLFDDKETDISQTVTAGNDVTMTVSLGMHAYPYGTSQWTKDPILYFLAPAGITLNSNGISAKWSDGSSGDITTKVDSWTLADGRTAYRIQFDGTAAFGGPSLNGGTLTGADRTRRPVITLRVNTAVGMKYAEMFTRDSFFVSENGAFITNTGTLVMKDVNELAGDKNTYIGCYHNNKTTKLTITPNVSTVKFTTQARMEDETDAAYRSGTDAEKRLYITDNSSVLSYRVKLENDSGGIVNRENFYYYIPVPKIGVDMPSGMCSETPGFGFNLIGAASVSGNNATIYDLRYSTDATANNYDNGAANFDSSGGTATWLTAQEVSEKGKWDDVNMVKLIVKETVSAVPRDTVDYFTLKLQCDETQTQINNKAGSSLAWRSSGGQIAADGKGYNASPSEYTSVMLRCEETADITMTARKVKQDQKDPHWSDIYKIQSLYNFAIPMNITVQSITLNNVTLDPSATFCHWNASTSKNDPCDATGEAANTHFGVTAAMNDSAAVELSGGTGNLLGTIEAGSKPELTLKLFNHNAMSDSITPRSVTLVLGDGAGIQLTVNITIARELAAVENPQSHIQSGKFYNPLPGSASSVKVTQNSALTAQYSYDLTPANASSQSLVLTNTSGGTVCFPQGAVVTMIDSASYRGESYLPQYYYYKVPDASTSEIPLGSFVSMKDGHTPFDDPAAGSGGQRSELLSFIVDFGAGGNSLGTGVYNLRLRVQGAAGSSPSDQILTVTVAAARNYSFTASGESTMSGGSMTVTGTASANATAVETGTDSRWDYRKMALVVSLKDSEGRQTNFPDGTVITMGAKQYVPSGGGIIILPLGDLGSYEYNYTLTTPYLPLTGGSYSLVTKLLVSATANASLPMGGDVVGEQISDFTVKGTAVYALNLVLTGEYENKQLFTREQAANGIPLLITYNDAVKSIGLTLEIQEKFGDVYLTGQSLIEKVTEPGNMNEGKPNANGVVVRSAPGTADSISATLRLNTGSFQEGHTYRIVLKTLGASGSENRTVVYNFIIIE